MSALNQASQQVILVQQQKELVHPQPELALRAADVRHQQELAELLQVQNSVIAQAIGGQLRGRLMLCCCIDPWSQSHCLCPVYMHPCLSICAMLLGTTNICHEKSTHFTFVCHN